LSKDTEPDYNQPNDRMNSWTRLVRLHVECC